MNLRLKISKKLEQLRKKYWSLYFKLLFSWRKINPQKIVFCNFTWCGYGCNPKYIAEEIIKQNLPFELVWLVKPEFLNKKDFPKEIKIVNYDDINTRFYELSTAKIWIDNVRKIHDLHKGLNKKKGQIYINTWHGSLGIKKVDAEMKAFTENSSWVKIRKQDAKMTDYMISNSEFETNVYRNSLWFDNEICKFGHPRNDILVNGRDGINEKVRTKLNIPNNSKIVLHVPSCRDNFDMRPIKMDYTKLKETLEKKFDKSWTVVTRFHPRCLEVFDSLIQKDTNIIDASYYPDIQELLVTADISITDYSSCIFDFMLTKKPGFFYAVDYKEYNITRGLYFPLEETPFLVAQNIEELVRNIEIFDNNKYLKSVEEFLDSRDVLEDGKASERVVKLIKKVCKI